MSEEAKADNGLFRTDELIPQLAHDSAHSSSRIKLIYSREDFAKIPLPEHAALYPELRHVESKHRLLPWIHGVLRGLNLETAADPFTGGGCVAYLLKNVGKRVAASDFLDFPNFETFFVRYGECMAQLISTTVRLEEQDVRALKRARADGLSASDLIRKGLRVVASRYYSGRRPPSTLLFESTNTKLGDESELFRDLED